MAAVLDEDSDCSRALLRTGVRKETVLGLSAPRDPERPAPIAESPAGFSVQLSSAAREILACAAGVAAAFGDARVGSEHLIVALIWTDVRSQVQRLLQDVPGGRPQLAKELREAGIRVPDSQPPPWPKWGERLELTREEAEAYIGALQERGQHFVVNWRDEKVVIIAAEGHERR